MGNEVNKIYNVPPEIALKEYTTHVLQPVFIGAPVEIGVFKDGILMFLQS